MTISPHVQLPTAPPPEPAPRPQLVEHTVRVELGPAMTALSERWRHFCLAYHANGGNATDAARQAGYSDKHDACQVRGWELLQSPRVQAALRELAETDCVAFLPNAIRRVKEIANNPQHVKQLDALKWVAGQGGMREKTEHKVTVEMTADEEAQKLLALAKQLGRDPREFLGENAIDVKFEDVSEKMVIDGEEY